jgi:hypothetical protein
MLYPTFPPDPGVDAFQANETLLVVMPVTWKSPGVLGGVGAPLLSILWACKENMATAKPSATTLAVGGGAAIPGLGGAHTGLTSNCFGYEHDRSFLWSNLG